MLRRSLPSGLIGLGVLLLAGSAAYWVSTTALANPSAVDVPRELAGRPLTSQESGTAAVADITRLHGKDFPLTSGAMAVYGGGAVTLRVSGAPAAPIAAEMVRVMRDKIAEGRSPFQPLETRELVDRTIHVLEGMGQRHFYFQAGVLVVWLAADEALAEQALMDTLLFYS